MLLQSWIDIKQYLKQKCLKQRIARNITGGGGPEEVEDTVTITGEEAKIIEICNITALDGIPFGQEIGRYNVKVSYILIVTNQYYR